MKISTIRKTLVLLALVIAVAVPVCALTGSGTESSPYQITSAADLAEIANNPSAFYKQTTHITINDVNKFEFVNGVVSGFKDDVVPAEWTPIENFTGNYNGGGFYITGLYVSEDNANGGLFANVENATIKDVRMDFALVESDEYAGIVAGKAVNSSFSGIAVSGAVIGMTTKEMNTVGGILGMAGEGTTLNDSVSYATVTGATSYSANVGGLVGTNYGTITASAFGGKVCGTATYYDAAIGGIAGLNAGNINNCRNAGTVGGESTAVVNDCYVGGIAGLNKGTLESNINEASVSAKNYSSGDSIVAVGGIAGMTVDADVSYNTNNGAVSGEYSFVGGIAGVAVSDSGAHYVEGCDNTGGVSGLYGVAGGIVGRAIAAGEGYVSIKLYIDECYNSGDVEGNATGEMTGETATVESASVKVLSTAAVANDNTATAKVTSKITADAIQYGSSVNATSNPAAGRIQKIATADSSMWIVRFPGATGFAPAPVLVELINVTDAGKVEILGVDASGLSYADGKITGNVVVKIYRPDTTEYDVVLGTSTGAKFADVDFAVLNGSKRVTEVTVPVDCTADAGTITVNALVVENTDTMKPVCENKEV